ncbi:hypothetical protein ALP89_04880 [Pseudomonas syringae pv. persicae]|nr:hypothetical protein ALP89_04880 [Pseudomonas syringae pv. persicae]
MPAGCSSPAGTQSLSCPLLRVGMHFVTLRVTFKPSRKYQITHESRLLPGGRKSELVRDLPGTGSKTGACGTSGSKEVTHFRAASYPILIVVTS